MEVLISITIITITITIIIITRQVLRLTWEVGVSWVGRVSRRCCKKRNRYIIATIANIVSIKYIIVTIANIIGRKYMKQFLGTSWVGHVAVHSWALSS